MRHADKAVNVFTEIPLAKSDRRQPVKEPAIEKRLGGFYQVIDKLCPAVFICVQYAERRIEPDWLQCNGDFGRENAIEVIQHGLRWQCRAARISSYA